MQEKDYTYLAPLYVNAEFVNGDTGEIKSQTVFMGDFLLCRPRTVPSSAGAPSESSSPQLVRSPASTSDRQQDRTSEGSLRREDHFGRGAWLEFEIDKSIAAGASGPQA